MFYIIGCDNNIKNLCHSNSIQNELTEKTDKV